MTIEDVGELRRTDDSAVSQMKMFSLSTTDLGGKNNLNLMMKEIHVEREKTRKTNKIV